MPIFAIPFSGEVLWEFSSAGLEHLPYKQRVGGSNPSTPTKKREAFAVALFFYLRYAAFRGCFGFDSIDAGR